MGRREIPVVVALGALSVSVALAFGSVFDSSRYAAPVIGAALGATTLGAASRWRGASPTVMWLVSGTGLLLYALIAAPGTGSPGALAERLTGGWRLVQHGRVPLTTTNGAILLAVIAVWIVAAASEALALGRDASVGALAPGLCVVMWVTAAGVEENQALVVVGFGIGAVVFLAVQHQALLGRRRARLGETRTVDAPGLLAVAIVAGVISVAAGVTVASALPGGRDPWFSGGGATTDSSYRTSIPPLLDVGDKLRQGSSTELFRVQASEPDYWRITALDEYRSDSGGQWTLTAEGDDAVGEGLDDRVPAGALSQSYRIGPLGERWMPAAYRPVRVSRRDTLVVRASSTLVTAEASVRGLRYRVESVPPVLEAGAAQQERTARPVPAALRRYTRLPDDFPASVRTAAAEITAGLANPYDRARALRDFFRGPSFTYDPSITSADDEATIARFLVERRGFCVQFASAFATMARAVGIPSRVAVGFTPGTREGREDYVVTNYEAHAWPEIWLAGIGWTHAFDPTPPSDLPGGSDLPDEPAPVDAPAPSGGTAPAPGATAPAPTPTTVSPAPGSPAPSPPGGDATVSRDDTSTEFPWLLVGAGVVLLLGIAPAATVVALKARRRARRRHRPDPTARIAGAWSEAVDQLTERRLVWPPSTTPFELARHVPRVTDAHTAKPMQTLAEVFSEARYGGGRPSAERAQQAWAGVDALRRALHTSANRRTRLRARLDPTTLRRQPEPAGWSPRRRSPSTND